MDRRSFLGGILAAGAAPFLPGCLGSGVWRPGRKVNLACVGIGCQAWYDIQQLWATDLCNVVALCDTDLGGEQTLNALNAFPKAKLYRDFRAMFDEMANEIDAVLVANPDHSHFPAAMAAMKLGKAVYVEKPLAHTFEECALLAKAASKYGVVTQMGNQGHSEGNYFQFREYVKTGLIKDVSKIVSHMNFGRRWHKWNGAVSAYPAEQFLPVSLDWDVWLGTAQWHAYNRDYVMGDWRSWYDFGNGCLGDWGAHVLDTAHEFLDLGLPTAVEIRNVKGHNGFVFPMQDTLTFKFRKLDVEWWEGTDNLPEVPWKTKASGGRGKDVPASGAADLWRTKLDPGKEIYQRDGTVWRGGSHGSLVRRCGAEREKLPPFPESTSTHWKNFLLAVMGEERTRSPFSVAAPLSQVFCLGCIAQRLNRSIRFDESACAIVDDPVANALLRIPPRKGWESFYRI